MYIKCLPHILLVFSALSLSTPAVCMFNDEIEDASTELSKLTRGYSVIAEPASDSYPKKIKNPRSFHELIEEKREIQKSIFLIEFQDMLVPNKNVAELSQLFGGMHLEGHGPTPAVVEAVLEKQLQNQEQIRQIVARNDEIDMEFQEAMLDAYRKKRGAIFSSPADILYPTEAPTLLPEDPMELDQNVIPVPDIIPNRAPQSFYVRYDGKSGYWFGLELLQPDNISWWRERIGWEATMEFGQSFSEQTKKVLLDLTTTDEYLLESRLKNQVFRKQEYQLMSLKTLPLQEAPQFFQDAYQGYTPCTTEHGNNYLVSFRRFNLNLDQYGKAPTWVAYVVSERLERPLYQIPNSIMSPALKMAMTATVGGPFYNPSGDYSSPIAHAFGFQPTDHLFLLFHSFVAKKMGEIDPNIRYVVTNSRDNVRRIFEENGLPVSSSFGNESASVNLPVILDSTVHGGIQFLSDGRHTPYMLFDPRLDHTYLMGENHFFLVNINSPVITLDRQSLAEIN